MKRAKGASKAADGGARRAGDLTARFAQAEETILALRKELSAARSRDRAGKPGKTKGAAESRLEDRVRERTRELTLLNEELQAEIADRILAEESLRTETAARQGGEASLRALNLALAESEERFRSVVQNLPVGVCIVRDGEIVFANPEGERLLARQPQSETSRLLRKIHPEEAEAFDRLCGAASQPGSADREADVRLLPCGPEEPGTEPRWVRVRAGRLRYQGQDLLLLTMLDITRAKELEHVVAVREKLASLGQVSAGIAHEIRNPLSGINIYLSLLEQLFGQAGTADPDDAARFKGIMEQTRSASAKIADVIQRVLSYSKPMPARRGSVRIDDVIEEALRISRPVLRKAGIAAALKPAGRLPECRGDAQLLVQVVVNLVGNAAQAMEDQETPRLLEVSSSAENGRVVVRVSDSGPGVPARLRTRIFEPFYTSRKDGYGIGLSFSHSVVTEHGGSLTVGTSRWGGAEFRMELPPAAEDGAG